MKINHAWKQSAAKPPKYVPYDQYMAALKIMQRNSYDFAVQLICDLSALAVHEAYGFGEKHMEKFRDALAKEINGFSESVNWEFKAETQGLNYKQRQEKRPDLAYTMERLDDRLREIVPDLKPFQQRYGGFGGRVSFADKEQSDRRVKETLRKLKEENQCMTSK